MTSAGEYPYLFNGAPRLEASGYIPPQKWWTIRFETGVGGARLGSELWNLPTRAIKRIDGTSRLVI
jgi:hypothetical protein